MSLDLFLLETVMYQPCLTKSERRYQSNVVAVGYQSCQQFSFFHTVTKIVRRYVSVGNKRIRCQHNVFILKNLNFMQR